MTSHERKTFALGGVAGLLVALLTWAALPWLRAQSVGASGHADAFHTGVEQSAPATQNSDIGAAQPGTTLQLSPEEITAAGVEIAAVRHAKLNSSFEAFGRVEEPEAQLSTISTRTAGRIDALHLQYAGQSIRRGGPVAEIYSPDIAAAVGEYQIAKENRAKLGRAADPEAVDTAEALVAASRRKLQLWGVSDAQLNTPSSAGASAPHITIYSPATGTVVERKVSRGQYVNAGDTLFTIADLSTVWVKADVYESQLPQIRSGQQVEISSEARPDRTIHGRVEFVEPNANPQTRTVPVHIHLANPGLKLLPGMFVRAQFVTPATDALMIPRSAVLDSGTRKVVYIAKPEGVFEAREIAVGAVSKDAYPVLSGLSANEKVVTNGNFLIDSQTRLGSGMTGMFGGSKQYSDAQRPSPTSPSSEQPKAGTSAAKISFAVTPDPPKGAAENMFHATVTAADGKPVQNGSVKVTLVMPAMPSMGMPEMRNSFELPYASGMYMGKGNIAMAGPWNVTVEATKDGQLISTFHTHLNAK